MAHPRSSMVMIAALLAGVACRRSDRAASGADSAGPPAAAASPNVVVFHAKDYAFTGPAQIPAGMTTFELVNDGPGIHHMAIVRLDSGKTLVDAERALKQKGPPPHWMVLVGGPNAPSPHDSANATLDMQPGSYALMCMVDIPNHVPHFIHGMVSPLTVTPSSDSSATAPRADEVITMTDFSFQLANPLTAGKHTIAVRNTGAQPHELELIRLASGKTPDEVLKWMEKPSGPPPGEALGGVAPFIGGHEVYFTADLAPGKYMLVCFIPDVKDGKPHFVHGMMQEVTVT